MNKNEIEKNVVKDCPILFKMYGRPPHETCMSYGFECGEGWHQEIANTCRILEMYNNLIYPKYRVRIQADQIKEKYGTLRFYYSIEQDSSRFFTYLSNKFTKITDWLSNPRKFNYELKRVDDEPRFEYTKETEISKEEYESLSKKCTKPNMFIERDGKYFQKTICTKLGKWHYEPTKHKIIWKIKEFCRSVAAKLSTIGIKDNSKMNVAAEFLENKAYDLIRKLETKCESVCEFCGKTIGTEYSPTCQTVGWIKLLCEDCAKKGEAEYFKNKKKYLKGKLVKAKKQKKTSKDKKHEQN